MHSSTMFSVALALAASVSAIPRPVAFNGAATCGNNAQYAPACCDVDSGMCTSIVEAIQVCPTNSMYCCDVSKNKGFQVNLSACDPSL